jgi:uncharacterized protein YjeT (DUF2065 family)
MSGWTLFLTALGLAMLLEGLPYLISPSGVRSYLRMLERMDDLVLRGIGLALIVGGLLVAYFATR